MAITGVNFVIPQGTNADALLQRLNPHRRQSLVDAVLDGANLAQEGINGDSLPAPVNGAKWKDPGDPAVNDQPRRWNAIWSYVFPHPAARMKDATRVNVTDIRQP